MRFFVDEAGRFFIGDEHNHAVRVVEIDGRVSRLAGTGVPGLAPDGSRAQGSALNDPENIIVRSDGSIIITEGDNGRVIQITRNGIIRLLAGRSDTEQCSVRW